MFLTSKKGFSMINNIIENNCKVENTMQTLPVSQQVAFGNKTL